MLINNNINYFPIFINLKNKNVLIIGGNYEAFKKVKLLIKTNATIIVVSKNLCFDLKILYKLKKIIWINKYFQENMLNNIFLIIVASNNKQLCTHIKKCADKKSIFINIIDLPKYCSFIFPSIISRYPITIGISSNGIAPILTQKIRIFLEKILPNHLGSLAYIIQYYRFLLKKNIHEIKKRRAFWIQIFKNNFINLLIPSNFHKIKKKIYHLIKIYINQNIKITPKNEKIKKNGSVSLVGAGPGDTELLTIRALKTIQNADIILYDYSINSEILNYSKKNINKINVGKKHGKNLISQKKINELLISYAKKGYHVVRLKTGDPFIFGRGGEEIQILYENNISFQVVPGITAAIGAAAYTNIPLTHRKYSNRITFITGHTTILQNQKKLMNWDSLVFKNHTIVIYMGISTSLDIQKKLIKYGWKKNTPIALISHATTIKQRILIGTLNSLVKLSMKISTPGIIIIGNVVSLYNKKI